jgi:hypothetical protein
MTWKYDKLVTDDEFRNTKTRNHKDRAESTRNAVAKGFTMLTPSAIWALSPAHK